MGRNAEQNQQSKERRREDILSAALALFATNGFAASKVSDISIKTGMSQGLLYHYFQSKEQIYTEIIATAFTRLNDACRALEADTATPRDKISNALQVLLHDLKTSADAARYHVLIAQANLSAAIPDEARQIIAAESGFPYAVMQRIFAAGQRDGTVKSGDPAQMASAFWICIKGFALHKAVHGEHATLPDYSLFLPMFLV